LQEKQRQKHTKPPAVKPQTFNNEPTTTMKL